MRARESAESAHPPVPVVKRAAPTTDPAPTTGRRSLSDPQLRVGQPAGFEGRQLRQPLGSVARVCVVVGRQGRVS